MSTPEDLVFPRDHDGPVRPPTYLDYITNPGGPNPNPGADAVPDDQYLPATPTPPRDFSPYIPGTVAPSAPSPPTVAPPSAVPLPGTPPISPMPSQPSPAIPNAPPPQSMPPALPSEPPIRIWEDHREWSGERRTEPRSRIPIPRTPAPVFEGEWSTRPQPSPVWPIVGVIGRAVTGIAGIFWPSEMGNGELTPEQQQEARDAFETENAAQLERERFEHAELLRNYERTHASEWPGRYHRPQVEGTADGLLEREFPAPAIPDRPIPVPVPQMTPPAPATFPRSETSQRESPSTSPRSSPRPTRTRVPQPQPTFGQELLEQLLEGLLSGASTWARNEGRRIAREAFSTPAPAPAMPTFPANPFTDPLTPPRIPGLDPLTPPRGNPLTGINTGSAGSAPPSVPTAQTEEQDRCRCKPKKRKPARKCHAKAGLRWVGGPKSGQLAGSRCYAFTNGD